MHFQTQDLCALYDIRSRYSSTLPWSWVLQPRLGIIYSPPSPPSPSYFFTFFQSVLPAHSCCSNHVTPPDLSSCRYFVHWGVAMVAGGTTCTPDWTCNPWHLICNGCCELDLMLSLPSRSLLYSQRKKGKRRKKRKERKKERKDRYSSAYHVRVPIRENPVNVPFFYGRCHSSGTRLWISFHPLRTSAGGWANGVRTPRKNK